MNVHTVDRPLITVVTGASRGLGLAIAHRLGETIDDGRVVLTARCGRDAVTAANALQSKGVNVEPYANALDVADPSSVRAFAGFAEAELGGRIDLLVNNAAICQRGWEPNVVRRTLRTNVIGPLALSRIALPGMRRRRHGHILHVSSGDGELVYLNTLLQSALNGATSQRDVLRTLVRAAPPREAFGTQPAHGPTPAYALSKAALNALTRIAAAELPPPEECGVRVSAVCPGDVLTRICVEGHALQHAVPPCEAAVDVVWLALAGLGASHDPACLDSEGKMPSGRFWRARQVIDF